MDGPYFTMLELTFQNNYLAKFMRTPLASDFYEVYVDMLFLADQRKRRARSVTPFYTLGLVASLVIVATYADDHKSNIRPLCEGRLEKLHD
ncbi:hypothetical protein B0H15DRAFT_955493 [Mycena belliarum]|uniref:Uncharacterized protein n=1 Tax=Mycena belliarum TaxID=1033014 RepID=A0AAD6TR66_9AGAR|nr:hypothetical protein B0H15DRAFT_955493 [Mycena belliae]